jgi:hypothetical protein
MFWFKAGERRRFAMAIALRADFDAARLRRVARDGGDAKQVRRLLALATIYDGASRSEATKLGEVGSILSAAAARRHSGAPSRCYAPRRRQCTISAAAVPALR